MIKLENIAILKAEECFINRLGPIGFKEKELLKIHDIIDFKDLEK